MAFFGDFALFFRTIDGLLRFGAQKISDKFSLPLLFYLLKQAARTVGPLKQSK
jgi:hypothetical protein